MAGIERYFHRLRTFWFPDWASFGWLLLTLPVLYFFQTTIHEGSHALTAFLGSGVWPKLAPFPHATPDGRFLNGVTFDAGGFIATPQFVDLGWIIVLALIMIFWPIRSFFIRFLLRLWFLGVCVDLMYNTARELVGGHNPFADWSRFQDSYGIPDAGMIVLTWLIWLVVLSHFVWVYFSAWHRDEPEPHCFWDYRWVAFIFGLLSLTAVVVSIFVGDPQIVKGHAAFILPFIIQTLALVWYWAYFGWSFRRDR